MGSVAVIERVKQIAKNADLSPVNDKSRADIPLKGEKPLQGHTGRLQGMADANARLRKQYKAVLSEYSNNRRRAGSLRVEIATGARDGDDLLTLLDKSLKCITCMTGDTAFYNSVMKSIKDR